MTILWRLIRLVFRLRLKSQGYIFKTRKHLILLSTVFFLSNSILAQCDLTDGGILAGTCNNNATLSDPTDDHFSFSLNPVGSNIGATYSVSGDITGSGISYGAPAIFDNSTNGYVATTDLAITITDDADPSCTLDIIVEAPGSCSTCNFSDVDIVVSVCDDGGTTIDPTDDTFTFTLEPSGVLSANYNVSGMITQTNISGAGPATFNNSGAGYSASTDLYLTLTDENDSTCISNVTVLAPGVCSACLIDTSNASLIWKESFENLDTLTQTYVGTIGYYGTNPFYQNYAWNGAGGTLCRYNPPNNSNSGVIPSDDSIGLLSSTVCYGKNISSYGGGVSNTNASSLSCNSTGNVSDGNWAWNFGYLGDDSLKFKFNCSDFTAGKKYFFVFDLGSDNNLYYLADGAQDLTLQYSDSEGLIDEKKINLDGLNTWQTDYFQFCPPARCGSECSVGSFNITIKQPSEIKNGIIIDNIRILESDCQIFSSAGEDESTVKVLCSNEPGFNLFDELAGTPSTNGYWSDANLQNGYQGTFDPVSMGSGTFSYIVESEAGCKMSACTFTNIKSTPAPPNMENIVLCTGASFAPLTAQCGQANCLEGVPTSETMTFLGSSFGAVSSSDGTETVSTSTTPIGNNLMSIDEVCITFDVNYRLTGDVCGATSNYYLDASTIEFNLTTPDGTVIDIVNQFDFSIDYSSYTTHPEYTMCFSDVANTAAPATLTNGSFLPPAASFSSQYALSQNSCIPADGTYALTSSTLSNLGSPCISSFSVKITSQPCKVDEMVKWYGSDANCEADFASGAFSSSNTYDPLASFTLNSSVASENCFHASCNCNGCESETNQSIVTIIGYENVTVTQICDTSTVLMAQAEDYQLEVCFDAPIQGPTPKFTLELLRPGSLIPLIFGKFNYSSLVGGATGNCITISHPSFDARDLETGIEISIVDADLNGESCFTYQFDETSCCTGTKKPDPSFDLPDLTCGEDFVLNPIDNNSNTSATSTGSWSGNGLYLIVGGAVPSSTTPTIDQSKVILDLDYSLTYNLISETGCTNNITHSFILPSTCEADAGKF